MQKGGAKGGALAQKLAETNRAIDQRAPEQKAPERVVVSKPHPFPHVVLIVVPVGLICHSNTPLCIIYRLYPSAPLPRVVRQWRSFVSSKAFSTECTASSCPTQHAMIFLIVVLLGSLVVTTRSPALPVIACLPYPWFLATDDLASLFSEHRFTNICFDQRLLVLGDIIVILSTYASKFAVDVREALYPKHPCCYMDLPLDDWHVFDGHIAWRHVRLSLRGFTSGHYCVVTADIHLYNDTRTINGLHICLIAFMGTL